MQDIEDAIKHIQAAVNKTPSNHLGLSNMLHNLEGFLYARYNRMSSMQDIEDAIKYTQAAVNKTPPDHPGLAHLFNNHLGVLYQSFAHTTTRITLIGSIIPFHTNLKYSRLC